MQRTIQLDLPVDDSPLTAAGKGYFLNLAESDFQCWCLAHSHRIIFQRSSAAGNSLHSAVSGEDFTGCWNGNASIYEKD